jgi:hypothetical protein
LLHWVSPAFNTDAALARAEYKINFRLEQQRRFELPDLGKWVAPPRTWTWRRCLRRLIENIQRLRYEAGSSSHWCNQTSIGVGGTGHRRQASRVTDQVKRDLALYDEEIYFAARADAPFNYIHEIMTSTSWVRNKRLGAHCRHFVSNRFRRTYHRRSRQQLFQ